MTCTNVLLGTHKLARLAVNHRTPAEIMAVTTDLLATHHPATPPPRSARSTGETPRRIRTTHADLPTVVAQLATTHTDGQLAIITPAVHIGPLAAALSTPTPLSHNDLYVAMTRATHRLGIVHPGPPPAGLAAIRNSSG